MRSPQGVNAEAHYQQLCEDFRSLNTFLWQLPILMMTLTGGLWYGVANFNLTPLGQSGLLYFAAAVNIVMILAMVRLRSVMSRIQESIFALDGRVKTRGNYTVVRIFSAILFVSALGSGLVGLNPKAYFKDKEPSAVSSAGTEPQGASEPTHVLTGNQTSGSLTASESNQAEAQR